MPTLSHLLCFTTSDDIKKVAVAAAAMWQSTLGVRVKLENQEWKSYLSTMNQGEYDVARSAWCADYNEPSAMLAYLESDKLGGRQFADTHYDALVHQASLTQAADARREAYRLADAYLVETVPIIPIFYPVRAHLMAASLRGFGEDQAGPLSSQDLYRAPALSGESVPE
ncbi:ABC transporter substrate-binding protein [Vibrio coralliilyticus]|uniref:ABC transporter substrate-binding protein n=1 Tax=Vibrio coralliilyticus TaxID=190893 RepID=UPI0020B7E957|nr:ABC transporter substrate-binding protein [Vibrio coralliilyticus]